MTTPCSCPTKRVSSTSTDDLAFFDPTWVKAYLYFYKLVAVDRHGNLGPAALLTPDDIKVGTLVASFAASLKQSAIEVSWTLSEAETGVRFSVLRSAAGAGFSELSSIAIVRDGLTFSIIDRGVEPGTTYRYRVDLMSASGARALFETEAISTPAMPLTLQQNHPNPFNPSTTIGYYLPEASVVTLEVYDLSGRLVARLADGERQEKGTHSIGWRGLDAQGRSVSSGVYFYRLICGKETISKKMVLCGRRLIPCGSIKGVGSTILPPFFLQANSASHDSSREKMQAWALSAKESVARRHVKSGRNLTGGTIMMKHCFLVDFVLLCVVLAASAASAQWVKDGIPVGSADNNQENPFIVPDGAGGAMIVWRDGRNGKYDIYGNRVGATGMYKGGRGRASLFGRAISTWWDASPTVTAPPSSSGSTTATAMRRSTPRRSIRQAPSSGRSTGSISACSLSIRASSPSFRMEPAARS